MFHSVILCCIATVVAAVDSAEASKRPAGRGDGVSSPRLSPGRWLSVPEVPGRAEPVSVILARCVRHLEGGEPSSIPEVRLVRDFVTAHNGVRHVTLQQQFGNVDLFGCRLRASIARDGRVISLGSSLMSVSADGSVPGPFESAVPAVRDAALAAIRTGGKRTETTGVRRVYLPLAGGRLRPAWEVLVRTGGTNEAWEVLVDDEGVQVVEYRSRQSAATTEDVIYLVFDEESPAPGSPGSEEPTGWQATGLPANLVAIWPHEIEPWSPNGWIDDGDNTTWGNNVDARLDQNADDQPDYRPSGVPYRVFNYAVYPHTQSPADYADASVVQLFFVCNLFHDRMYELGFTEAAHNFQMENFGRGGVGGDPIIADAQDGASYNRATFTTGAQDGSESRLQTHLFPGPTPDRDAAFDRDLVFHELAHGVVVRLLESHPDAGQPAALAEGWADYFALALNAEPDDDRHGTYPFAPYVAYLRWSGYVDNYYYGLRRFPYCTDPNKNPLTYADIDPAQFATPPGVPMNPHITTPADDPHNAGEVWCAALMDCRAALIGRHGDAGNARMLQLAVDGLMMLPTAQPTFLEARDAVLTADLVDNSGANLDLLWQAFAGRGLGGSAASPGIGAAGVAEAFDIPGTVAFGYPEGVPGLIPTDEERCFPVVVVPTGGTAVTPGSSRLYYAVDGGGFASVPLAPSGGYEYMATLPANACGSRLAFYLSVQTAQYGQLTDPPNAPGEAYTALVAYGVETVTSDDFEHAGDWTVGADDDDAVRGRWSRMDPQATLAQPEDDHTPSPGIACWVTDGRAGGSAGSYDVDGGKTTLTSPILPVYGEEAVVSYWRWYSNTEGQNPAQDVFLVQLSNDGGESWTTAEEVGPSGAEADGGWWYHEFMVGPLLEPTPDLQLRFVASDLGDPSLVEAAVDDLLVTQFFCYAPSPGDANRDGAVNLEDYAPFVQCLSGPMSALPGSPSFCADVFDFDGDGDVDLGDAASFEALFTAE